METLFRLVLSRPAVTQDDDTPSILLDQNSSFQDALRHAETDENPTDVRKRLARQFVATSSAFVGHPKDLSIYEKLRHFRLELDGLETKAEIANVDVVSAVNSAFGLSPDDLIADNVLDEPIASLRDTILAIKQLPEEHSRPIAELTDQLRDLEVILKVRIDSDFPSSGEKLRRFRRRSLQLPSFAFPAAIQSTTDRQDKREKERKEADENKRKEAERKLEQFKQISTSIAELVAMDGEQFQASIQKASPGFLVPNEIRPIQVLTQDIKNRQQLSQLKLLSVQSFIGRDADSKSNLQQVETQPSRSIPKDITNPSLLQRGSPAFQPIQLSDTSFRLKPSADGLLSEGTRTLLRERKVSITEQPLDRIVENLQLEKSDLANQIDGLLGRPVERSFKRVGNTMIMISTPLLSIWDRMLINNELSIPEKSRPDPIPKTHGSVKPVGVADLLVVKQQLVRYEPADIAHIENIVLGEKKVREHTRRRETEEFTFRETEITTSEEHELESTNRFEMSRESSETIREDASLRAGLTVSGKYGPTVEFAASAEGSTSRSKEEASKSAAKFSQDVTERTASKITERMLQRTSLRVTNEVIDKNVHTLDNSKGTGHISAIYQWINKVYQAQMFNYGIRTMYDFMVPEPAAFLLSAMENAHKNAIVELEKPAPFLLRPDQITESNYSGLVQQYGATGIEPPPEMYRTNSLDYNANAEDKNVEFSHSGQIALLDGYIAVHATVGCVRTIWEDEALVDVVIGARSHRFEGGDWVWSTGLDSETDSIPLALVSDLVGDVAIAVKVKSKRTERAMTKWRLETHSKVTEAYMAKLAEYEQKLAELDEQVAGEIQGKNPSLNLDLMNDELKKQCISILTDQHFELFGAIRMGQYGIPEIDLRESLAEGPYVRFFEQAFEWEHMTWITYPYFWGRKSQWTDRITYDDADPLFNQFLKSGYCRVVVPVRPGFEGAIDHFMKYAEVWNGKSLPPISDPLYLSIADEIAERLDRPGDEIAQGNPWLVRLPSTLVKLRTDDKLPSWKKDSHGEWVEA